MRIGDLRQRVTFQKLGGEEDEYGAPVPYAENWSDYATVWASIVYISGEEFYASQNIQNKIVAKIFVRYRKDLDVTMRVIAEGKVFHIVGINPDNRKRMLTIFAEVRSSEQITKEGTYQGNYQGVQG